MGEGQIKVVRTVVAAGNHRARQRQSNALPRKLQLLQHLHPVGFLLRRLVQLSLDR